MAYSGAGQAFSKLPIGCQLTFAGICLAICLGCLTSAKIGESHAHQVLNDFNATPGCANVPAASSIDTAACTSATGTIVSIDNEQHRRVNHYFADVSSAGGLYSHLRIGTNFYNGAHIGDTVQLRLWKGQVVQIDGGGNTTQTDSHPNRMLMSAESGVTMPLVFTVFAAVWIAIIIWAFTAGGGDYGPDQGSSAPGQPDPLAQHAGVSPDAPVAKARGIPAAPPPALGDEAGLNDSDMWK